MILYDCHAHVYESVKAVASARYIPPNTAPLQRWLEHQQSYGLQGGVIVQVSFLGTDNSELCHALQKLGHENYAGVAVVDMDVSEEEIDRLRLMGVRGFRWNLVRGAAIPNLNSLDVRTFLERVYARGMHIEVHLESRMLAPFIIPLLGMGGRVVVDHLGLPECENPNDEPWLLALEKARDLSALYVKFSAPYRSAFNTRAHEKALLRLLHPDHVVWGSDWPHTQHESVTSYNDVATARQQLCVKSDAKAVNVLYGLNSL